jgi:hypothetical protein
VTPPFGLADALMEEDRADCLELFFDRPQEVFRLLAQPLDVYE